MPKFGSSCLESYFEVRRGDKQEHREEPAWPYEVGANMTNLSESWNQKDRAVRNLLNYGLAIFPMTLLIKDHKTFDLGTTPPTRSVMGGNVGGNKPISEYMSLILEPVAN